MARGIIIFGSAGSGKTTLGKMVAEELGFPYFVMAGSMDSFNAPFVPLFDLAVHITAPVHVRIARINNREYKMYGEKIVKGGDMYEEHQHFLEVSARYDTDGSPCMKTHEAWTAALPCKVIRLYVYNKCGLTDYNVLNES